LDDTQLAGEIWLVPVCNPLSTNQRTHFFSTGRFNVYDGKDWNRIFWDYEKECEDLEAFAQSQINLEPADIWKNYLERIQSGFKKQLEICSICDVVGMQYVRLTSPPTPLLREERGVQFPHPLQESGVREVKSALSGQY